MTPMWQCRNATILQIKAELHPDNFHEDALMYILFFPWNKWHGLCCQQLPSSPHTVLEDVISQRVLLSKSTHKWSQNVICQQTCWDGCFAVNNRSVGEESPSRRRPSCEQLMGSAWGHSPAAPQDWANGLSLLSTALVCPKASWLQRAAQIFGNCHCLVLNCHVWPFSRFILQGYSPLIYITVSLKSANDFLAQKEPCSTSVTWHELTQGTS